MGRLADVRRWTWLPWSATLESILSDHLTKFDAKQTEEASQPSHVSALLVWKKRRKRRYLINDFREDHRSDALVRQQFQPFPAAWLALSFLGYDFAFGDAMRTGFFFWFFFGFFWVSVEKG